MNRPRPKYEAAALQARPKSESYFGRPFGRPFKNQDTVKNEPESESVSSSFVSVSNCQFFNLARRGGETHCADIKRDAELVQV